MTNPTENLDQTITPTQPLDGDDLPRFGQLVETAKDVLKKELIDYFNIITASDATNKILEIPNIEKFALGSTGATSELETVVNLIMQFADTPQKFPCVAITASNLRQRNMNIGVDLVAAVQYPPYVDSSNTGPFTLQDGWTLTLKTRPLGTVSSEVTSTIVISSSQFSDITSVTTQELADVITKQQALYYKAVALSSGALRLQTGGPLAKETPNYIEITGGTAAFLTELGFTVGQSMDYTDSTNPPRNRYGLTADLTLNVDVVADSLNTRGELADLIYTFFAFYLEKNRFQFIGRSYQETGLDPEEWYHIVLQNQFNWGGETATPRQGGEQLEHIYSIRGSVPVTVLDYIDRTVTEPSFVEEETYTFDSTLPQGDYFSNARDYRRFG